MRGHFEYALEFCAILTTMRIDVIVAKLRVLPKSDQILGVNKSKRISIISYISYVI